VQRREIQCRGGIARRTDFCDFHLERAVDFCNRFDRAILGPDICVLAMNFCMVMHEMPREIPRET
jgi:hypothetical protein